MVDKKLDELVGNKDVIAKEPIEGQKKEAITESEIKNHKFNSVKNTLAIENEINKFINHNKRDENNVFNVKDRVIFNDNGEILELNLSNLNLKIIEKLDLLPLENLRKLDLSNNNLTLLRIKNYLPFVEEINVKGNPLKSIIINSGLKTFDCVKYINFAILEKLNLSENDFTNFNFNNKYKALKKFIMCRNKSPIREIKIMGNMPYLEELILIESNIESFEIKNKFSKFLTKLDIRKNKITYLKLPSVFFEKENNKYMSVYISENPLPDLYLFALKKNTQEDIYNDLKNLFSDTITVNKVKLIFLGNTGVGKTTLYKVLKYDSFDYIEQNGNSTEGVNIFDYNFHSKYKKGSISHLIHVKGYDFGGQDYYHNTHYSHFSSNALYILLWGNGQYIYHRAYFERPDTSKIFTSEITYPLNYWLGSVSYFLKNELNKLERNVLENQNIKLYLIQNPIKKKNDEYIKKFELNRVDLKERYPFIENFDECDSLTLDDFPQYQSNIKSKLNSIIESYAKPQSYPKILYEVELNIKNEFKEKIIVSLKNIEELFLKVNEDIKWNGGFQQIIEWLDITMSVYWVSDNKLLKTGKINFNSFTDFESNQLNLLDFDEIDVLNSNFLSLTERELLKSYAILDLSKVDRIIHDVLENASLKEKKGYYTKTDFNNYKYFKNDYILRDYIFAFMLYNKICFEAPDKNYAGEQVYIAPSYLNDELSLAENIFLNSFDLPLVEYRFEDFYHVNVFTEVLVQFKKYLSNSDKTIDYLLWKNKAVLFDCVNNPDVSMSGLAERMHPLVYLEFDLGEILSGETNKNIDDRSFLKKPSIKISTYAKNRYSVSNIFISKIINFIDNQLIGYNYKKYALAPNNLDYVDVNAINKSLLNHSGNSTGLFTYNNHLYRFSDFSLFTKKKSPMKKIFISHSTEDYRELQSFTTHLYPLKKLGLIDHWHCSQLVVGEQWDSNIQEKLWDSDIICMLISPSWLANEYIFEKELKIALDRKERFKNSHQGKDIVIFPIIVKPCSWHLVEALSSIQAAPQKAKTISSYADQNEAWCDVIRKLNDVLKRMDENDYIPPIGERLGKYYIDQYEGNLSKK
ncbi:TIR domain-containing protein [Acinetobacter baumannii]|uniref:TIR domain-containing protein n=1 Tax=Acinetobacter baumannii TaxID=470 RepID=UPI002449B85F|nr:TIR domain-containing protein [Acinetobacter baumannii]EKU9949767.1 TIR domain-containing protein [Acinetobacter baumannii]EKX3720787.1 TIR domain-containing protein [Acinetobacter baumannii]EKX3751628.1 TIR domain-containing protein [Acinetobacter baumannii]MDH2654814.1 TIR domain-containing protein [Acinetobacter baumannii]HAV5313617.1 TIR domain-containing protein [Acinetobacter baumannii]